MMIEVIAPKHGLPYLTNLPDVPNVPPEWQAEMARLLATMDDDDPVIDNTSTPHPPVSHVRQCVPQEDSSHGERGSHLLLGNETATRTAKVG